MTPGLLWILATVDAAFTGYREAAGRNALIDKSAYYRRAMFRGAIFGQIAVAVAGVAILAMTLLSSKPMVVIYELRELGLRMLIVYLPYALVILIAFIVRTVPSVDVRSITSVLIFGPFTLLRPVVVVVGIVWGVAAAPSLATVTLGMLILTMMLSLEWVISKLRANKRVE